MAGSPAARPAFGGADGRPGRARNILGIAVSFLKACSATGGHALYRPLIPSPIPASSLRSGADFGGPGCPRGCALDPVPKVLGAGVGFESETMRQVLTAGAIRTAIRDSTTGSETEELDWPVRWTLKGLTVLFGFTAGWVAGASLEALGRWAATDLSQGELTKLRDTVSDKVRDAIPEVFTQGAETTTTVTYSQSRLIDKMDEHAITQHFFLQDRDQGMTVAIYYDTFFGTFAFAALEPVTA
jgi:hypothetical protein